MELSRTNNSILKCINTKSFKKDNILNNLKCSNYNGTSKNNNVKLLSNNVVNNSNLNYYSSIKNKYVKKEDIDNIKKQFTCNLNLKKNTDEYERDKINNKSSNEYNIVKSSTKIKRKHLQYSSSNKRSIVNIYSLLNLNKNNIINYSTKSISNIDNDENTLELDNNLEFLKSNAINLSTQIENEYKQLFNLDVKSLNANSKLLAEEKVNSLLYQSQNLHSFCLSYSNNKSLNNKNNNINEINYKLINTLDLIVKYENNIQDFIKSILNKYTNISNNNSNNLKIINDLTKHLDIKIAENKKLLNYIDNNNIVYNASQNNNFKLQIEEKKKLLELQNKAYLINYTNKEEEIKELKFLLNINKNIESNYVILSDKLNNFESLKNKDFLKYREEIDKLKQKVEFLKGEIISKNFLIDTKDKYIKDLKEHEIKNLKEEVINLISKNKTLKKEYNKIYNNLMMTKEEINSLYLNRIIKKKFVDSFNIDVLILEEFIVNFQRSNTNNINKDIKLDNFLNYTYNMK